MNGWLAALGLCASSPWASIQLPNDAQAAGSCQPKGSFLPAGSAAGKVLWIDSS